MHGNASELAWKIDNVVAGEAVGWIWVGIIGADVEEIVAAIGSTRNSIKVRHGETIQAESVLFLARLGISRKHSPNVCAVLFLI